MSPGLRCRRDISQFRFRFALLSADETLLETAISNDTLPQYLLLFAFTLPTLTATHSTSKSRRVQYDEGMHAWLHVTLARFGKRATAE